MNFFDILADILTKTSGTLYEDPEFDKVFSQYLICRYLSMDKYLVEIAEVCNFFQGQWTNKQMYLFLMNAVPKRKSKYIRYISKPKKKEKKTESEFSDIFNI